MGKAILSTAETVSLRLPLECHASGVCHRRVVSSPSRLPTLVRQHCPYGRAQRSGGPGGDLSGPQAHGHLAGRGRQRLQHSHSGDPHPSSDGGRPVSSSTTSTASWRAWNARPTMFPFSKLTGWWNSVTDMRYGSSLRYARTSTACVICGKVMHAANERYLAFIAAIDNPDAGLKAIDKVAQPVREDGRSYRGFNLFLSDDYHLFLTLARGEWCISGFRAVDLRAHLPWLTPTRCSWLLKRLRTHGLIKKVGHVRGSFLRGFPCRIRASAALPSRAVRVARAARWTDPVRLATQVPSASHPGAGRVEGRLGQDDRIAHLADALRFRSATHRSAPHPGAGRVEGRSGRMTALRISPMLSASEAPPIGQLLMREPAGSKGGSGRMTASRISPRTSIWKPPVRPAISAGT